ncbi:hypothetical protein BBBOND_0402890 [Babesia bigemina]|uniref:Uncharacterized protein n=1 Tax=Babesia bigemina TaxID=5866 RepID=A0A061DAW8_BABBI|nr:hypothetical protein BBBOND_0402890 [Babesia bigemina]CDR97801.1 hypothetical protein BBBOND_0402890 [Babesia bigemina]|eukprot:XP_012769987.1 hypothetical protein BBBOND_0402890 [Babesia bigemina]
MQLVITTVGILRCINSTLESYFAHELCKQYLLTSGRKKSHLFCYSKCRNKMLKPQDNANHAKPQNNVNQNDNLRDMQRMLYHSLTDVPRNLKECLDWLIAVKGTSKFNTQALGYALYNFLVDKPVGMKYVPSVEKVKRLSREFMQKKEFKDLPAVGDLLRRFTERMNKTDFVDIKRFFALHESDYENIVKLNGVTPDSIAKDVDKIADGCEQFLNEIKTPGQYESAYSSEATWEA